MNDIRVAVLRGGPSEEYAVSMQSGSRVLAALDALEYPRKDIVITKKGEWLDNGFVKAPERALEAVDVVFIALHGTYGEDGQVQRILERKCIPYTGSAALTSAIAFNKELTKQTLLPHQIKMPRHRRVTRADLDQLDEELPNIFKEIGTELFVKPLASGSSFGAQYVPTETILRTALEELLQQYETVLVEQFIRGKEATVGVLSNFRNESAYVLPVIEIVPPNGLPLFSHEDKYNGKTDEIVPGRFSYHEKAELTRVAAEVHEIVGCRHYSRSDFIVKDGEVYFLEVNTLPGLTAESLFPKAAAAVGLEYPQLIDHLVKTALTR
ncbi:D-alanine--D-alanine ligase [Candidatus Kaiserbacteria bacterium]|nr:D-alanine--D-alanine ligase [Candidatus Kaiserbacteria bacterium]